MAHKKEGGSASNLKDSNAQRLGVKRFDGEKVKTGNIIVRQRGTKFRAGKNIVQCKNYNLTAKTDGYVKFITKKIKKFNGNLQKTKFVNILKTKDEYNDYIKKYTRNIKKTK
jgi:large subunit ribosomal protein L27